MCALALLALMPRAGLAQSDTAAVLGTVQGLFDGMAARDTIALRSILTPEGRFTVVVVMEGDSVARFGTDHGQFIARFREPGPALLERMWQPIVLIEGAIASVWTPYDFYIDGEFSHCGIDVFTLAKTREEWRISGASYSVVRSGCAESPLGPP